MDSTQSQDLFMRGILDLRKSIDTCGKFNPFRVNGAPDL
jgi:hypothetical protein